MFAEYNRAELDQLILDGVEEDTHLDYKAADALGKTDGKKNEIAKDVSAFANSDGGTIIYGIKEFDEKEKQHLPEKIDPVDRTAFTKETLDQIINSKIRPKIPGVIIKSIDIPGVQNGVVYVVLVPRSTKPHQASDNRYYKRYNFESRPMEDYEINDVRSRQSVTSPLIIIDADIRTTHMVYITVSNIGSVPALDVSFTFPSDVRWIRTDKQTPSLFTNGIKVFPPGKTFRYMWNMANTLFAANDPEVLIIDASATYTHGFSGQIISDEFHIDLEANRANSTLKTDVEEVRDIIKESAKTLTGEIAKLNRHLDIISTIAGPTGLDVSQTTLRNIKALLGSENELEKIPARECPDGVFREVLQIDWELGYALEMHFRYGTPESLDEIEGLTPEIVAKIHQYFYF